MFTPSTGHTYFPPTSKNPTLAASTQATQASKESTPMPMTQDTSVSTKASLASKPVSDTNYQSLQLLAESYSLYQRYGKEYMDENPLVGEPGSFILSKSREPGITNQSHSKTSVPSKLALLPEVKTTSITSPTKRGSKGGEKSPISPGAKDKKGRRKSKAAGAGTTTTPK